MKKLVSVCVFLLAFMTGAFAMAQEPVYGVLFIPKKEYTLEKGKFRATVPQVQAVSFIDGRTPVNECGGAAKAVNKQLRAYVDKAYQDYQKEGEPGTWVYPMITKNGDNIYSLVMVKQILHGQLDIYPVGYIYGRSVHLFAEYGEAGIMEGSCPQGGTFHDRGKSGKEYPGGNVLLQGWGMDLGEA